MEWYLKVLKEYSSFNGRARRKEYWMFILIHTIIKLILKLVSEAAGLKIYDLGIDTLYGLAVLLPYIAVGIRRMHDVGESGWYIIIPFYNFYLLVKNGDEGENQYGPDPKDPTTELDEIGVD